MSCFFFKQNTACDLRISDWSSDVDSSDLISYIRQNQKEIVDNDTITLGVTGTTAITVDIDNRLGEALPKYIAMVVGLSLILLIIVFRSIIVPLKATLG